jgi:hypothetical protein
MKLPRTVGLAVAVSLVAGTVAALAQISGAAPAGPTANVVDAAGHLREPADYRTGRLSPTAARARRKSTPSTPPPERSTPIARRGTSRMVPVLVKEVFGTSTNEMTTGTVSYADKLKGWFIMVKDSKGAQPGNPLWGDGWGWSWFDADKPLKTTSTDYHSDCQGCHVPAKATDWIYVNGYPVLHH